MSKAIKKAVIPAAGMGTRVLPASKAVPKEMLPIVDKPAIQYIVEEAVAAGIEDILIITNRGKGVIEDHFDHAIELEEALKNKGRFETLQELQGICNMANIYFLRQKETRGLGDAVLRAKGFVGNDPFAVLYGDDVIVGKTPATLQLADAYEKYGRSVAGIREVTPEQIVKYSSMKLSPLPDEGAFLITDMIEKPSLDKMFSLYSILGRCVLTPEIFEILEHTPLGAGNELQLTDAMKTLAQTKGMTGLAFEGTRFDMGNKFGIIQANITVGLNHPETAGPLKEYIMELSKTL